MALTVTKQHVRFAAWEERQMENEALRETLPFVQDMSSLVLDNAHFCGEVADEQDRQWYSHLPRQDAIAEFEEEFSTNVRSSTREAENLPISESVIEDFQTFTTHNRSILREQDISASLVVSSSASSSTVAPNATADFAVFSARSRNLGRMNSEQTLDHFLNQHQHKVLMSPVIFYILRILQSCICIGALHFFPFVVGSSE